MKKTGAQILCESLIKEGVEVIFGILGGAVLPIYDAFPQYPKLRGIYWFAMSREQLMPPMDMLELHTKQGYVLLPQDLELLIWLPALPMLTWIQFP